MTLYKHQQDGVRRLIDNPRYALFYDTGTGKTAIALSAMERCGGRWLVVCPLILIDNAWIPDAKKFTPGLSVLNLRDNGAIQGPRADVEIINYETYREKARAIFDRGYDGVVIDESSKMKNHQSQISKVLRYTAKQVKRCWLLSGTPAPNDELEFWAQMDALDEKIFGKSYYAFRVAWGKGTTLKFGVRKVQKWGFNPDCRDRLMRTMSPYCHFLSKDDCLDLPEMVDVEIGVELTRREREAYETMRTILAAQIETDFVVAAEGLSKAMKLRQIANGWAYTADGKPLNVGCSKFSALEQLLDETLDGKQVIIWTQFLNDAYQIFNKYTPDAAMLIGGLSETRREEACTAFKSGAVRILVAHPRTAMYGLTFTNCRNAVYYGLDYSAEAYAQSRDRIHRIGQTGKCTVYHLIARNTIDEKCLDIVRGKILAADAVREELARQEAAA